MTRLGPIAMLPRQPDDTTNGQAGSGTATIALRTNAELSIHRAWTRLPPEGSSVWQREPWQMN